MTGFSSSSTAISDSRLANVAAAKIFDAFTTYDAAFKSVTCQAQTRFENRDWHGQREDASRRLALYRETINPVVADIRKLLDKRLKDKLIWTSMKAVYSGLIADLDNWELAETFYNSVTRRIFATVGVDSQIEFVEPDFSMPPPPAGSSVCRSYTNAADKTVLIRQIITDCGFEAPFAHLEADCRQVAERIASFLQARETRLIQVEVVQQVFFRSKGAYLVGRLRTPMGIIPLALALLHDENGIYIDAVMLDEDSVSILFSFTRAYFHVMVERPFDLVQFISSILPQKRIAELYISLGYNKHGKTELYRDLLQHLARSRETFQISPGQRGMVMTVFTMPDYDLVFKIIKDRFSYPKKVTRQEVLDKYELVFGHDRAGRLIDAQEFEHLQFRRDRFSDALLTELADLAGNTVTIDEKTVVVSHAFVERRVTPLDLYLKQARPAHARAAILDYGQAIKDLAATNVFPGDMLLKNFGVTRHGRVVFYDYDELRPLTDCNFRQFPQARTYEDELAPEPWFHIGEKDVFPEEFLRFMGLPPALRDVFLEQHGDLLHVDFWRETQARLEAGEIISTRPYTTEQQLGEASGEASPQKNRTQISTDTHR